MFAREREHDALAFASFYHWLVTEQKHQRVAQQRGAESLFTVFFLYMDIFVADGCRDIWVVAFDGWMLGFACMHMH